MRTGAGRTHCLSRSCWREFLPGIRHVLNVFVDTPVRSRIRQVMARKGFAEEAAKEFLEKSDRIRASRIRDYSESTGAIRLGTTWSLALLKPVWIRRYRQSPRFLNAGSTVQRLNLCRPREI